MLLLGLLLLVFGAAFIAAEAHVPGGVLGMIGGVAAAAGGVLLIGAGGGGAALAVPVGVVVVLLAGGWCVLVARSAVSVRGVRPRAGREALCGRVGVVREWHEPAGRVFVEGALWRARRDWGEADPVELHAGDAVVVERVNGLTLSVRRADEWELVA